MEIKVTYRTLSTLLRDLIKPHLKAWDLLVPPVKFAYNKAPRKTTSILPFKVYRFDPLGPLDLDPTLLDQKPKCQY